MKTLVLGGGGLVGSRFIELADNKFQVTSPSSLELDILNKQKLFEAVSQSELVINFTGYTDVGAAEKSRPQNPADQSALEINPAYQLNVIGVKNLIEACQKSKQMPVFISTDFVFDGKNGPYGEDDPRAGSPEDISWYGWTKLLGEQAVAESGIDYLMLRISYPYRQEFAGKGDFGRDMLSKAATKEPNKPIKFNYPLFTDQKLTPTFIDDVAPAVAALLEKNCRGIYHLASPTLTTPFEFGCEVYRIAWGIENPEKIVPQGSLESSLEKGATKKPLHGGLLVDKLIHDTGFTPTDWKTGINLAFGTN